MLNIIVYIYYLLPLSFFPPLSGSSGRCGCQYWERKSRSDTDMFSPHLPFSLSMLISSVTTDPSIKMKISSSFNRFSVLLPQIVSSSKDACFTSAVETLQQIRYVRTCELYRTSLHVTWHDGDTPFTKNMEGDTIYPQKSKPPCTWCDLTWCIIPTLIM